MDSFQGLFKTNFVFKDFSRLQACAVPAGSPFPTGALQISCFKILPWQPNKMVTGHKTHKMDGLS